MAGVLHQADAVLRQACCTQGLAHQFRRTAVGADGFLAAPEDAGVAGFKAQGRRVHGDVGPGLKDDGNDSQGDPPPSDDETVGPGLHLVHPADGVRQGRYLPHAFHDTGDALRRQGQSVQHGRTDPGLFRGGHVLGVGLQPLGLVLGQGVRNSGQSCVFSGCTGGGEHIGGLLGRLALLLQCCHEKASFPECRRHPG